MADQEDLDLKCPTCGSGHVPTCIKTAIIKVYELPTSQRASIMLLLQNLYLHSDERSDEVPPLQAGMQQVLRRLSPETHAAIAEMGKPDPVYIFFRAEFGEPE